MSLPIIYKYKVWVPSELSAGIIGITDIVPVKVESGDSGEGFAEYMRESLSEWYDGGRVSLLSVESK